MSTQTHNSQAQNNHLTGKVALVQGGSRGIGAAIAKRLARDGATVAFPDHATTTAGACPHPVSCARTLADRLMHARHHGRILSLHIEAASMDASRVFRHENYELLCSAIADDSCHVAPRLSDRATATVR